MERVSENLVFDIGLKCTVHTAQNFCHFQNVPYVRNTKCAYMGDTSPT